MKNLIYIALVLSFVFLGCQKDPVENPGNIPTEINLADSAERFLRIEKNKQIFIDENQNTYIPLSFDYQHLSHIFGVFLEKDVKYTISISGNSVSCEPIDFILLTSALDTLFRGEQGNISSTRKYICWTSDVSDTFYISSKYRYGINFHTYDYQLTFEELSTKVIQWGNLKFDCSGDWFVNDLGYLTLACHNTLSEKWAKVMDDSLYNYDFSYLVSPESGIPDSYAGIACYASGNIFDMMNMPASCYNIAVAGPSTWRLEYWYMETGGGVGYDWGTTSQNLAIGAGSWNKISVTTFSDSIAYSVNSEEVKRIRNLSFMKNGLYITVEDSKKDTLFFKEIILTKK